MRQLKCHRCGSAELILREMYLDTAQWDNGLFLDGDGKILGNGEATIAQGAAQPKLTEIECQGCGHSWHPRREFAGPLYD